ncbi:uncharacterized protein LOC135494015 [Lineus longissimus]|uniref:uncharacterized protein LOC135494015 n=1 Tax=Lineus longissimus TaxID=88925 RepID=UPI002B4D55DF
MCEAGSCRRCWSRVPIASLISFIIYVFVLSIYIGCIISVFEGFISKYFVFVSLTGILVPVYLVLLGVGVFFLIAMILSTGETRKQLCKAACCNWTGRVFQLFNIIIVTALVVVFVIVSGVSILPNILFVAIVALCKVGLAAQIKSCDIFSEIGLEPRDIKLCDGSGTNMDEFCTDSKMYLGRTVVAYVVSIIISLCLVHFLVCMTSNYVRLKYETKTQAAPTELQELKQAKQELEESREAHVNEVKVEEVKPGNPFD